MELEVPTRRSLVAATIAVLAFAVFARVPSCYESFWLDELHSAWTVWDGIGDVYPRAVIGHQSPFYFFMLWIWKQVAGESEMMLRMSSVLPTAIGCVFLTIGVTRWTKSLAAGVTSGAVLALERNALFFGTELRPYAFVICFSSLAVVAFLPLATSRSRHDQPRNWSVLIIAILLAALSQPTSLGVLVWLPITLGIGWLLRDPRRQARLSWADGLMLLACVTTGFALWQVTLQESWQQKTSWASFATASDVGQIWKAWDWTWLLGFPLIVSAGSFSVMMNHKNFQVFRKLATPLLQLAVISIAATSLYWLISRFEFAPVWHRRYFIAVMPVFACVAGGAVGLVRNSLAVNRLAPPWASPVFSFAVGLTLVVGLGLHQGTLQRLSSYPVALVRRGEDWRAAADWVRSRAEIDDSVFLDAGLIEARKWLSPESTSPLEPRQSKYLTFPFRGPYALSQQMSPIHSPFQLPHQRSPQASSSRTFWITRHAASRVKNTLPDRWSVIGFGNVSVIFEGEPSEHPVVE